MQGILVHFPFILVVFIVDFFHAEFRSNDFSERRQEVYVRDLC